MTLIAIRPELFEYKKNSSNLDLNQVLFVRKLFQLKYSLSLMDQKTTLAIFEPEIESFLALKHNFLLHQYATEFASDIETQTNTSLSFLQTRFS
jgi:hypothetical protein